MTEQEEAMHEVARNLSRNLYILMGARGKPVKVKELAEKSGLSTVTISQIRNDYQGKMKIQLETVVSLAVALEVEPSDLLKGGTV